MKQASNKKNFLFGMALLLAAVIVAGGLRAVLYHAPLPQVPVAAGKPADSQAGPAMPPLVTVRADTLARRFAQAYDKVAVAPVPDGLRIVIGGLGEEDASLVCNNKRLLNVSSGDFSIVYSSIGNELVLSFPYSGNAAGAKLVRVPADLLFALIRELQAKGKA